MPAEYYENAEDQFHYGDDWKELTGDGQPGGGATVSLSGQEAVLTGVIPFNKQRACARFFLGHSYADSGSPYKLYREAPMPHPVWPHLRAASVSFSGLSPAAGSAGDNKVYEFSPFGGPPQLGGDKYRYANYEKAVATVRFRDFGRTRFLPDSAIRTDAGGTYYGDEALRWTTVMTESQVQALSADGSSQLKFAESTPAGPPAVAFPAPVAELLTKCTYALKWSQVPHEYVSDRDEVLTPWRLVSAGTNTYAGILSYLGKWNNASFPGSNGFLSGTMLFTAVKFDPMLFCVPTVNDDYPFTGYDITLVFEHFAPKKGYATSDKRGHRLFPWRGNGSASTAGWYWATRDDGSDFLPGADLNKIFAHIKNA